jgi:hypothetical protein
MPVTRVAADAERFLRKIAGLSAAPPAEMVREPFPEDPCLPA